MRCAINEIFGPTIQGEGLFSGVPSIFVRFNGCNLRCCFKGGSICDTAYTSHRPERAGITDTDQAVQVVKDLLEKYPEVNDIVFTGGEPMLQQAAMADIIKQLNNEFTLEYTVETNGTIRLRPEMAHYITLWSISPKLESSCCFTDDIPEEDRSRHLERHISYLSVMDYMRDGEVQLKFVYSGPDSEKEIQEYLDKLYGIIRCDSDVHYGASPILIMPEGETEEQLKKTSELAVEACIRNGWRFCDRVHIRIWGNKRAV